MIKLVTFNIRCDYDQDGANSFRFRKPCDLKKLAEEKPDVICFQEVFPMWQHAEREPDGVYCSRLRKKRDPGRRADDRRFRTDRLNLINMETFWLSPTPYVPASRYEEQSICPGCVQKSCWKIFRKRKFSVCVISIWIISRTGQNLASPRS